MLHFENVSWIKMLGRLLQFDLPMLQQMKYRLKSFCTSMVHFKIVGDKSSQTERGYGYEEELSSLMEEVTLLRALVNSDVGTFAWNKGDFILAFPICIF